MVKASGSGAAIVSKSAAKNAKRNAKKRGLWRKKYIWECWEDDDDTVKKPKVLRAEGSAESPQTDERTKNADGREEDTLAEGMSKLAV
jgi:hypothetical protein